MDSPGGLRPAARSYSCAGWLAWWYGMNANVRLALLQAVGTGVADSVWSYTLFASFVFTLADGSNTIVGLLEMLQGCTTLIIALPMGYLADRWSKANVIRIGGGFALVALVATSVVVVLASTKEEDDVDSDGVKLCLYGLGVCVCLWGVVDAVVQGPVPALFADSIPAGSRSRWYTYLFSANMAARTVGPAVTIAMFSICGDSWSLPEIRNVFLAGMVAELFNAPTFFFFDDAKALGALEAKQNNLTESLLSPHAAADAEDGDGVELEEQARAGLGVGGPAEAQQGTDVHGETLERATPPAAMGKEAGAAAGAPEPVIPGKGCFGQYLGIREGHIPYILFCMDIVVAFGSGMTIKFFPLFWKEEVGLSPSEVQAIFLAVPIAIAVCSGLGMAMARRIGRVFAFVIVKAVGLCFLVLMVVMRKRVHPLVLILFYLVRTGLMNCTYPLEESILMESVSPDSRARWKSLQSITAFGWTGSAALGGVLGDKHGYAFTFLITAALQGFGSSLILLIAHLVPLEVEEGDEPRGGPRSSEADGKYERLEEEAREEGTQALGELQRRFPQFFPSRPGSGAVEEEDDDAVYMSLDGDRAVPGAGDFDVEFVSMEDGHSIRRDPRESIDYSFDAAVADDGGWGSDMSGDEDTALIA